MTFLGISLITRYNVEVQGCADSLNLLVEQVGYGVGDWTGGLLSRVSSYL